MRGVYETADKINSLRSGSNGFQNDSKTHTGTQVDNNIFIK